VSVADAVTGPPSGPRLTPIRGFPRFTVPALDFRALLRHARPLPLLALLAGWWHDYDSAPEAARLEADPARAVVIALASQGLVAEPADVHFLPEEPRRFGQVTQRERAVVRANRQGEPADIFLVQTRHSPDGGLQLERDVGGRRAQHRRFGFARGLGDWARGHGPQRALRGLHG
jgi:hypothetical protein